MMRFDAVERSTTNTRQLPDAFQVLVVRLLYRQVQRRHAAFDIHVLEHDLVAFVANAFGAGFVKFFQQVLVDITVAADQDRNAFGPQRPRVSMSPG